MRKKWNWLWLSLALLLPITTIAQIDLNETFFNAISEGKTEVVEEFLQKDKSLIDSKNERGSSPIILAAYNSKPNVIKILIDYGANVNDVSRTLLTPLHFAANNGDLESIKILVNHGANIHVASPNGRVPWQYAIVSSNMEVIEYFHQLGCEYDYVDQGGTTLLHWAAYSGDVDLFKLIKSKGVDVLQLDSRNASVLLWAVSGGDINMIEYLAKNEGYVISDISETGTYPIQTAMATGRLDVVKYFLNSGVNLDDRLNENKSLLHIAAFSRDPSIADFFIEQGLDVNGFDDNGSTPLNLAAAVGNLETLKLLIDKGAKVNPKACFGDACNAIDGSPLHNAAWGHPEVITYLLENDANVTSIDNKGRTALHRAVAGQNIECVKLLIEAKSDVNSQDSSGNTPLHKACKYGNEQAVELLLANGSDVTTQNNEGITPLHISSIRGYSAILNKLLDENPDVDCCDKKGNSSLFYANYFSNKSSKELLLNKNASQAKMPKTKNALTKPVNDGEAIIWYLNHSGWAVKTKNNLLIFDYWQSSQEPDERSINNGWISPEEIKDQKVTVFVSHAHEDHFSQEIFDWDSTIKDITYVFGFEPENSIDYTLIEPRNQKTINEIKITTINSTDSGEGFLVEVDGVLIYHPGDHANGDREDPSDHNDEIDFLAEKTKNVDIAFFPVTGCRFQDKVALKQGIYYTANKLKPKVSFVMHGSSIEEDYVSFSNEANAEGLETKFKYLIEKGERFFYKN